MTTDPGIRSHREGRVFILTIDRPRVRNALSPAASAELSRAVDAFEADDDLWVAILTGAGDQAFCAGHDLNFPVGDGGVREGEPATGFGGLAMRFDARKPIIAAVNGLALGGGFTIALACDLIVASETARFGLPEVHVGLAAVANAVHRLPRAIGLKQAMGMILTGSPVSAAEGLRLGFVNEVCPPGAALDTARAWAARITAAAPLAVRASKQAVHEGWHLDLREASRKEYPAVRQMFVSEDAAEGRRAFTEKRAPQWQGR